MRDRYFKIGRLALLLVAVTSSGLVTCQRDGPSSPVSGATPTLLADTLVIWRDSQVLSSPSRPAFDNHAVYFLGTHVAYAVDKGSGQLLWSTRLEYPDVAPSELKQGYGTAVAAGLVIIGDVDVFGLDPQTGAVRWRFAPRLQYPAERVLQRLAVDSNTVYIGGVWGNVYAIDAVSGVQRWISHVTALPDNFVRVFNPILDHGVLYVAFGDDTNVPTDGGVAAFDAATGTRLWSQVLPRHHHLASTEAHTVAIASNRALAGALDGFVYALDVTTGAVVDTVPPSVFGLSPADTLPSQGTWFWIATASNVVTIGNIAGNNVLALDAGNLHRTLWKSPLNEGSPWDIDVDSTRVYVAYFGGQLAVLDLLTGKTIWMVDRDQLRPYAEEILAAPAIDLDRIYVESDRDVYAFKRK
jgi:outer membrane protein assembly factor BamB